MQTEMTQRYRKFKRGWGVYHVYDNQTGLSKSLETRSKQEAERLVHAMNEAERVPVLNRQIARAYLMAADPLAMIRTWEYVMGEKVKTVAGGTKDRWLTANRDRAFNAIRNLTLVETRPENFQAVLEQGGVATNVYLRKLHNFAMDMNWLLGPVLPRAKWPKVKYPPKRAITESEHLRICGREPNPERRAYYQVLWHTGASQTDAALMEASNVDREGKILSYYRSKTKEHVQLEIGPELDGILAGLPAAGPLFPYLRRVRANDRATEFRQRCDGLGIPDVTLHSYRYAWAQRADLETLRKSIRSAAPKAQECISYGLPAFRLDQEPLVAFGATSKHCAFYLMSGSIAERHEDELRKYDTSKGTIRFQPDKPPPTALVRKLVKARIAENREPSPKQPTQNQVHTTRTAPCGRRA